MTRNAIESDFRSSKMAGGGGGGASQCHSGKYTNSIYHDIPAALHFRIQNIIMIRLLHLFIYFIYHSLSEVCYHLWAVIRHFTVCVIIYGQLLDTLLYVLYMGIY